MKITGSTSSNNARNVGWKASDFTVQDYADAHPSVKSARIRKNMTGNLLAQNMQVSKDRSDLAWFEKDLSDFEQSDAEDDNIDETDLVKTVKKKLSKREDKAACSGVVYSTDIWCLIGEHVHPADIRRFAAICRGTHYVSHTARFWIDIYKRFIIGVNGAKSLPYELSDSCMKNMHGFRARVVRALFVLHRPFTSRLKATEDPFGRDPDMLATFRCCLSWYKEEKTHWYFYFKFHNPHRKLCRLSGDDVTVTKRDLLDDDNIHYNSEEGCCVLQVVSLNFMPLPLVMGQVLIKASLSVGQEMRYHKIKLDFDYSFHKRAVSTNQVVIDPVLNMQIFPWWHPAYPCNSIA